LPERSVVHAPGTSLALTAPSAMNIQPVIPMSTRPDPCRFDN